MYINLVKQIINLKQLKKLINRDNTIEYNGK